MVHEIVGRLSTIRPTELLTAVARAAVIQAATMSPVHHPALSARLPEITGDITRAAYATLLRRTPQPSRITGQRATVDACAADLRSDREQGTAAGAARTQLAEARINAARGQA
ncbi:hypothetical protein GCM10010515_76710 [Streptomyces fructofermentans]|uniref:Uncharacterized protein n=2 Tax=Streptomyces fructofermentans TaxID=152141 RepID=A0A918NVZ0_9ACTN|nr:hypothetical protein GCM10010515_76710 [Streptomyces fructofermentans]